MSDLAKKLAALDSKSVPTCTVALLLRDLDPTDAKALEAAMKRPARELYSTDLAKTLRDEGYKVGDDAVRRHRSGRCSCRMKTS